MTKRVGLFLPLLFLTGISACVPSFNNDGEADHAGGNTSLLIQPAEVDMGEVMEGREVWTTLLLRNTGRLPVHVARVESSCGCTVASPDTRELAAGAFTPLRVRVDTTAKRGRVRKSITAFDSEGGKAQAWLTLTVKPNPHGDAMRGKGLFDGKCASCHAEPAREKVRGSAIYQAVCAMCHGIKAAGAYAPALRGRDAKFLSSVLSNGLGRQMPSFAREKHGPLSQTQIANVSKWLSELDGHGL